MLPPLCETCTGDKCTQFRIKNLGFGFKGNGRKHLLELAHKCRHSVIIYNHPTSGEMMACLLRTYLGGGGYEAGYKPYCIVNPVTSKGQALYVTTD